MQYDHQNHHLELLNQNKIKKNGTTATKRTSDERITRNIT